LSIFNRSERELLEGIVTAQFLLAIFIAVGGTGVFVAGSIWPEFFQYNYLFISSDFISDVLRFWPLFLWAIIPNLFRIFSKSFESDRKDEKRFVVDLATSVGAGVFEEGWYRGVGIFYAMAILAFWNFVFNILGWIASIVIGFMAFVVVLIALFGDVKKTSSSMLGLLMIAALCTFLAWGIMVIHEDLVFWVYQNILIPITDFATLGLMHATLHDPSHQPLLVFGILSANIAFRNGHKYQGVRGFINSWYCGCVLIVATLNYGIWVAITVHAAYNIVFDVARYLGAKYSNGTSRLSLR